MSSYYHHSERKEQYSQNAAPILGGGSWINNPIGIAPPLPPLPLPLPSLPLPPPPLNVFTPAVYGGPLFGNTGVSSGYSVQSYSSPGYSYHYERIY